MLYHDEALNGTVPPSRISDFAPIRWEQVWRDACREVICSRRKDPICELPEGLKFPPDAIGFCNGKEYVTTQQEDVITGMVLT